MRALGVPPIRIEMAMTRMKWMKSMVAEAENHHMMLTAMFKDKMPFEMEEGGGIRGGGNGMRIWR